MSNIKQCGSNHYNWKGGRRKKEGYWLLYMPNHPRSNKQGCVYEHIYLYEQYYKCCVLPWTIIHHINNDRGDNSKQNLQAMSQAQHCSLHMKGKSTRRLGKHMDMSDRVCFNCNRNKTTISKPRGNNKTPFQHWKHLPWDKNNFYCASCYTIIMRNRGMENEKNIEGFCSLRESKSSELR